MNVGSITCTYPHIIFPEQNLLTPSVLCRHS